MELGVIAHVRTWRDVLLNCFAWLFSIKASFGMYGDLELPLYRAWIGDESWMAEDVLWTVWLKIIKRFASVIEIMSQPNKRLPPILISRKSDFNHSQIPLRNQFSPQFSTIINVIRREIISCRLDGCRKFCSRRDLGQFDKKTLTFERRARLSLIKMLKCCTMGWDKNRAELKLDFSRITLITTWLFLYHF